MKSPRGADGATAPWREAKVTDVENGRFKASRSCEIHRKGVLAFLIQQDSKTIGYTVSIASDEVQACLMDSVSQFDIIARYWILSV